VFIGVLNTTIINLKVQAELTLPVQYVADTRILEHCNAITKYTEKQYCNPGNKEILQMEYRNIATL
jgi:hypothetical protein